MARYPLGKTGFRKTIEGRAETDYLISMLQALMLAMPTEPQRSPPGLKAMGSARADRNR
jgi:hypothetical protein